MIQRVLRLVQPPQKRACVVHPLASQRAISRLRLQKQGYEVFELSSASELRSLEAAQGPFALVVDLSSESRRAA
ncbi:MAG TPA: hypothetical protein QGF58_20605 [Myxococcota bacterium]|nr:hypothetical protein [Myxococcota bacterium]